MLVMLKCIFCSVGSEREKTKVCGVAQVSMCDYYYYFFQNLDRRIDFDVGFNLIQDFNIASNCVFVILILCEHLSLDLAGPI